MLLCGLHLLAATPAGAQVTSPSVPRNVQVTSGDTQLTLSWQGPSSWGTWTANSFWIQWKFPAAGNDQWHAVTAVGVTDGFTDSSSATSVVFTADQSDANRATFAINNETSYDLRIAAESKDPNTDGTQTSHFRYSDWVTVSDKTPVSPLNVKVREGDRRLDLSWTAPSDVDGRAVTGYVVHYTSSTTAGAAGPVGSNPTTGWVTVSHSGTATTRAITGLTNNTRYRVRVAARAQATSGHYGFAVGTPSAPPQSSNANLSGLTASSSTSAAGTYAALTLSPSTFSAATTSYTATVANARTHAKLTPTVADTGKATVTVQGTSVNSGSASGAIALSEGANAITVRVTAEDGATTKDYTVTITREAATVSTVPTGLSVSAGNAELTASWTAPTGVDVSRYEVQIKLKSAQAWPGTDTDVTGTSHTFTGLVNGSPYQVRVRTIQLGEQTPSDWTAPAEGTPQAPAAVPTVSLSALPNPVDEGSSVTVTATLSSALGSNVTIPVAVTDDSAESGDHGTLTSIAINSGATSGTGTITTNQDPDEDDETFTVALGNNLPASVTAGTPSSVQITITDDDVPPTVRLSVSPNPVQEGSTVTVTATLSSALGSAVTIPVTLTDNTAEPDDYDGSLSSITINSGSTIGTGTIQAHQDSDTDDETFTVALDTGNLPASVTAGSPSSVQVRIRDDDGGGGGPPDPPDPPDPPARPSVRLSASPNPVHEGSSVTVTARLSSALTRAVTIPLRLTAGSAERDDYGRLEGILIDRGQTSGTGAISTSADADTDDETFTVALGTLPSSVRAGRPRSVEITITEAVPTPALPLGGALLLGLLLAWRGAVRVRQRGV